MAALRLASIAAALLVPATCLQSQEAIQLQMRRGLWICDPTLRVLLSDPQAAVSRGDLFSQCRLTFKKAACDAAEAALSRGPSLTESMNEICGNYTAKPPGSALRFDEAAGKRQPWGDFNHGIVVPSVKLGTSFRGPIAPETIHSPMDHTVRGKNPGGKFDWEKPSRAESSDIDSAAMAVRLYDIVSRKAALTELEGPSYPQNATFRKDNFTEPVEPVPEPPPGVQGVLDSVTPLPFQYAAALAALSTSGLDPEEAAAVAAAAAPPEEETVTTTTTPPIDYPPPTAAPTPAPPTAAPGPGGPTPAPPAVPWWKAAAEKAKEAASGAAAAAAAAAAKAKGNPAADADAVTKIDQANTSDNATNSTNPSAPSQSSILAAQARVEGGFPNLLRTVDAANLTSRLFSVPSTLEVQPSSRGVGLLSRAAFVAVEHPAVAATERPAAVTIEQPAFAAVAPPAVAVVEQPAVPAATQPAVLTMERPAATAADKSVVSTQEHRLSKVHAKEVPPVSKSKKSHKKTRVSHSKTKRK